MEIKHEPHTRGCEALLAAMNEVFAAMRPLSRDLVFTASPTVSGYYTFKINRYANRDTSLNLRLGMYVNYYRK